jgi:hypothetical protein
MSRGNASGVVESGFIRMSLGRGHEEHSDDGKDEHRHREGRGGKPHAWLFKLPRRAGEEEHGGGEASSAINR